MRNLLFLGIIGLGGTAVLLSLGIWQVQRMGWKQGVIAAIEAKLTAPPADLPATSADDGALHYRAISATGQTDGTEVLVLSGRKTVGAGYRVISAFVLAGGRRVMLDRGFIPESARHDPRPATALAITGNLMWPKDADSFTPPPDMAQRLWFARDVPSMAEALNAEPLLIVAATVSGDQQGVDPEPVTTETIPNNHFGYAMTWFSLALVWAGMTGILSWRIRRRTI